MGTHLARGYSLGDPRNHYNTHTRTVTHNTITSNCKQSSLIHTHCVVSGSAFFQIIQGCRAGFESRTSHNFCSASSLKLPLSHPCTPIPYWYLLSCVLCPQFLYYSGYQLEKTHIIGHKDFEKELHIIHGEKLDIDQPVTI